MSRLLNSVCCLAAVCVFQQNEAVCAEREILQILPTKTLAYLEIGSLDELTKSIEQSPLGQLWNDPSLRTFREQLETGDQEAADVLVRNYGIDFDLLLASNLEQFTVAGFETKSGTLSLTFLLKMPSSMAAQELFAQSLESVASTGAARKETSISAEAVTFSLADNAEEDVTLCVLENLLMISGDLDIAQTLLNRWSSDAVDGLGNDETFRRSMAGLPDVKGNKVAWYIKPVQLAVVLSRTGSTGAPTATQTDGAENRPPFEMRHGLPGLKAMTGVFWLPANSWTYRIQISILAPPPRTGFLAMFDFPPNPPPLPPFVPATASTLSGMFWNLEAIIPNLGDIYDDIVDSPDAFKDTLNGFRDELRVDLEQEIFAKIGPEVVSFSIHDQEANIEGSVISVNIKQPEKNEKKVASAVYGLLVEDSETQRRRLPGFRYELWQMTLVTGDGATPFSKAGIMVANGRLWIATHALLLEKVLTTENAADPIVATEDYKRIQKVAESGTQTGHFSNTYSRVEADFRYTYQVLKAGGIEGLRTAENLYSQIILKLVEQVGYESDVDFSTLPEFAAIAKYLGFTAINAHVTESGWEIQMGGVPR